MTDGFVENAWRNIRFRPAEVVRPQSVEELQAVVRAAAAAGRKVRLVGGGHSMNHVYRTDGVLIDIAALNGVVAIDPAAGVATIEAGRTIGDSIEAFAAAGLHFPTLGSWYTQSLAGAIATSTHGSSMTHGSLSDIVLGVEAVMADGSLRTFGADDPDLPVLRCHLGQIAALTKITLQLTPEFWLRCDTETLPAPAAFKNIVKRARAHEYVNMLFLPDLDDAYVRMLERTDARERNAAAVAQEEKFTKPSTLRHRIEDVVVFTLAHLYQLAPRLLSKWYGRKVRAAFFDDQGVVDKSYRVFLYDQYREPTENHRLRTIMNVEYAIDIDRLEDLLAALRSLLSEQRKQGRYINYPRVHVRFAPKAPDTLIALNADRDTAYVGIYVLGSVRHKKQIPIAEEVERLFIAHGGRPHWGKYSYLDDEAYRATYAGLSAFAAARARLDPTGVFGGDRGMDMFRDLPRFERPPRRQMLRSVFEKDEYQDIRLL